jgi:hypothetical protein
MYVSNEVNQTEAPTTKWELIRVLNKDLSDARARVAYCKNKLETGASYLGDVHADLAAAKARATETEKTLKALLASPET